MEKKVELDEIEVVLAESELGDEKVCEIVFNGKLVGNNVSNVTKQLESIFPDSPMNVIVDLSNLSYVNSTGLSLLLTLWKKVINNNHRIIFFNLHPFMNELFSMTELHSKFEISDDKGGAVEKLKA